MKFRAVYLRSCKWDSLPFKLDFGSVEVQTAEMSTLIAEFWDCLPLRLDSKDDYLQDWILGMTTLQDEILG